MIFEEDNYKRFMSKEILEKIIRLQRYIRLRIYIKKVRPKIEKIIKKDRNEFVYQKTIFGTENPEIIRNLKIAHRVRQTQMKEGDIAQLVLGNFFDWENLGTGHETGLDIMRRDKSAIVEIKNKWNTCNSSSFKACCDKLSEHKKRNPETRCILGIINPKNINKINASTLEHNGVVIEKLEGNELLDYVLTYKNYNYKKDVLNSIREILNSL